MNPTVRDQKISGMAWRILARGVAGSSYQLRLARGVDDIRAAQTLRFQVFNLELNEGFDESYLTGLDADRFDEVCDHLLVECISTGQVVGTYRLQTGTLAATQSGYYSETEFDFSPFEPWRDEIVELGRACVHAEHRNIHVLGMLWQGIAAYARERECRYLIGCSSIPSQDPRKGAALYFHLMRKYLTEPEFRAEPLPEVRCPLDEAADEFPAAPKLLSAYLSIGAKLCGPPAIDRQFKTIDFLTLLDLDSLPPAAASLLRN